ncbi:hypothetical protein FACS189415_4450 [Bacteroidia bacterium]|nr:hypothetical protein FACS189414_3330 [Bacteroidia bacterium]GHU83004.1 hypothetical protein FACS189415_4450 [Bacteroidia bacterium]
MHYGLKETDIEQIREVLASYSEVVQAILYGSRAKGNFKPASDIDLTLKGNLLNLTIQYKIENVLPYKMDISIFHQISNPDLVDHINRVGQVLYERHPQVEIA